MLLFFEKIWQILTRELRQKCQSTKNYEISIIALTANFFLFKNVFSILNSNKCWTFHWFIVHAYDGPIILSYDFNRYRPSTLRSLSYCMFSTWLLRVQQHSTEDGGADCKAYNSEWLFNVRSQVAFQHLMSLYDLKLFLILFNLVS